MLPSLAEEVPSGGGWIHEIKHEGYRTQVLVSGGRGRAFTRNGHDWSDCYEPILRAAAACSRDVALDGQVVVQDETGRSDFRNLCANLRHKAGSAQGS